LDLYEEQTAPLIAWYLERDMLVTIDGLGIPDDVFHRMVRAIDVRRHG
jgi:adenylate kinase family enzyme